MVPFSMEVSWSFATMRNENVSRSSNVNFYAIKCTTLTRKMKIMPWQAYNLLECSLDFCLGLNTDH